MINKVEQFIRPRASFEQLQRDNVDPNKFTDVLRGVFGSTQHQNKKWIEGRFQEYWGDRDRGHWSWDGILVNRAGRIIYGPWSTYLTYLQNEPLDLTMDHLRSLAIQNKDFAIPLVPPKRSTLFWLLEHEDPILLVLRNNDQGEIEVEDYKDVLPRQMGFLAMAKRRKIRMVRIESGKIGNKEFAKEKVVRGALGFWQNSTTEGLIYTPRVRINRSTGIEKQTYISPIQRVSLLTRGGLPMEESHPNVRVLRTDPEIDKYDFITAALLTFADEFKNRAFVLRYDTYRPWDDFLPQHGGSN